MRGFEGTVRGCARGKRDVRLIYKCEENMRR